MLTSGPAANTASLADTQLMSVGDEATRVALEAVLAPHNQHHVLRYWDELSEPQRIMLAQQIQAIDLNQLAKLTAGNVASSDVENVVDSVAAPPARRLGDDPLAASARVVGAEAIRSGLFGVVIVAGGQGSRLGFPHPKGMYPIGPVNETTLFRILIEKIRAVADRYEVRIPLYLMTSPATHEETVRFLNENDRFGLEDEDLYVFCQGTMPAVDEKTGKLLLADRDSLFLSPNGHGGMLAGLQDSGALDNIRERGIEHLFYCQVDNALVDMLNPEFLGYHILGNSDVTTQVVAKRDPAEKVGVVVAVDNRLQMIEYSDLPQELAERRAEDGSLELWAGNIAVHGFSVAFLEGVLSGDASLPFHVARKKIPHIDDTGELVKPVSPNGVKFEQFIFDLLPVARRSLVVEVQEAEAFAPLKNAEGKDSPEDVKQRMMQCFRNQLKAVGFSVDEDTRVEISPLFADSADTLRACAAMRTEADDSDWYLGPKS